MPCHVLVNLLYKPAIRKCQNAWGAYYVSCQKRLFKIKYGFEGSISNDDHGLF